MAILRVVDDGRKRRLGARGSSSMFDGMRALTPFVTALVLLFATGAPAKWYVRASAQTVVGVVAFSEDGTEALLQEKQTVRDQSGALRIGTTYVVVNGTKTLFETKVSDLLLLPGQPPVDALEAIERPVCRDRVALLEKALQGFRDVQARISGCARVGPGRGDHVVELEASTPTPMTSTKELQALQVELGIGPGLAFVNERGPLVVVLRAAQGDPYGKSNEALTFLRSDPRIHDRWPAP